jgi:3-hydroxyacyl-[acyl-carrier-protein] dehydratase
MSADTDNAGPASVLEMTAGDPDAPAISLDQREIQALLPHRHPFVMVDRVDRVVPGCSATGIKAVTASEPWFAGHFPGNPILPGVLITEAFAQLCALTALTANRHLVGRPVLLLGLDKVRFRQPVVPGDRLVLHCERLWLRRGLWRFSVQAEVDGAKVASAELSATVFTEGGEAIAGGE